MQVQFYFSPLSRYSYLAASQLPQLAHETGVKFDWIPISLDRLLEKRLRVRQPETGTMNQNSTSYILRDVRRWAKMYNIPFVDAHDRLPVDGNTLVLACTAARVMGAGEAYAVELMRMIHATEMRLMAEKECLDAAVRVGLPRELFRICMHDARTNTAHEAALADAHALELFGVPSFALGSEVFWGNDRLPLLRQHILQKMSAG